MAQVNYKVRMLTYRENHLDSAQWEKIKSDMKEGKRVSGVVKLLNPLSSVMAYAMLANKAAGNEMPKDETTGKPLPSLLPATVTSIRNGLLDDIGLLYAQTSIVKPDAKKPEMTGDVWFAEKIKASKGKLHMRDFAKALDDLAKADKKAVVHKGVTWEIAEPLLNYSTGKKGKQKKSILKTIDEI